MKLNHSPKDAATRGGGPPSINPALASPIQSASVMVNGSIPNIPGLLTSKDVSSTDTDCKPMVSQAIGNVDLAFVKQISVEDKPTSAAIIRFSNDKIACGLVTLSKFFTAKMVFLDAYILP
ncbi:uncharacterized protein MELLADRAFT_108688 [Melampsora larici-populina 98AG31]|uniref:Uncharacterized protein n=1 Tax=Melampsora larici-populina (strain 98AG31 / pathotype 3-4-7) TaxID=747676 RepID=F4RTX1_MELLP|nr:uncharacterized protein MELLADRAFT_108688 [Melampsora larici-populina 98AG31]EGG04079.1 hypothetical protein MELLADRAFT_108688 [Melampsora larici-populina 98AG31]